MAEINIRVGSWGNKTWLAEITGIGGKFGVDRNFIGPVERDVDRRGNGWATYRVENGVFESSDPDERTWHIVENGEAREVDRDEALAALETQETQATASGDEVQELRDLMWKSGIRTRQIDEFLEGKTPEQITAVVEFANIDY